MRSNCHHGIEGYCRYCVMEKERDLYKESRKVDSFSKFDGSVDGKEEAIESIAEDIVNKILDPIIHGEDAIGGFKNRMFHRIVRFLNEALTAEREKQSALEKELSELHIAFVKEREICLRFEKDSKRMTELEAELLELKGKKGL